MGFFGVALAALVLWFVPVPYYAMWPGPISEVVDFVHMEEAVPVYSLNGDLYLLTVSLQEVNPYALVVGWLDSDIDLVPRRYIRPEGVSPEEQREANLRMMDESVDSAILAALGYLGWSPEPGEGGVIIRSVLEEGPSFGKLRIGDVVVAVDATPIVTRAEAAELIGSRPVGERVALTVLRDADRLEIPVDLAPHLEVEGRSMLGVGLTEYVAPPELPFEVEIDRATGGGGPSAGLMYALGLVDLLTEEDLVRGNRVAGTGTITPEGFVGPIGGVRQKVIAARLAGAEYVLVPQGNFADAVTADHPDIEIVAVSHLRDAVDTLRGMPG